MMYGFFAKRTDPPSSSLLFCCLPIPSCLRLPPSSTHSGCRSLGHVTFITLQVLLNGPTTDKASPSTSLALIGLLTPMLLGTLSVLLRSRAVLPYRAVRNHLGAV